MSQAINNEISFNKRKLWKLCYNVGGPILTQDHPVMKRIHVHIVRNIPSRQKQVYNRRTVRTVLSPTMTTTGGQSGPCLLGREDSLSR